MTLLACLACLAASRWGPDRPAEAPDETLRSTLVGELNRARVAAGRAPLEVAGALTQVAQERARELAAAGSLEPTAGAVVTISRRLRGAGYEAHAWAEHSVQTDGDVLEAWREVRPDAYREALEGDFTEAGIGVGEAPGVPVYTFLLALPERVFVEREAAPLRDLERVRREIAVRVNEARREAGRPPLGADPRLDRAAQRHAEDMLGRAFYGHRNPEGEEPMERLQAAGYAARWAGENIAKGLFSPEEVVERWLESSGHRRNLLAREFTALGVGVAAGENERGFEVLWVQVFGAE